MLNASGSADACTAKFVYFHNSFCGGKIKQNFSKLQYFEKFIFGKAIFVRYQKYFYGFDQQAGTHIR